MLLLYILRHLNDPGLKELLIGSSINGIRKEKKTFDYGDGN